MEWIIVAIIGALIGMVFSLMGLNSRMPQPLGITLGTVGALAGAMLVRVTGSILFGTWTLYVAGAILALGFLVGGMLAYGLTDGEKRV